MLERTILLLVFAALPAAPLLAQEKGKAPVEVGAVAWERDYIAATRKAERSGKPLLLLFQEVPG